MKGSKQHKAGRYQKRKGETPNPQQKMEARNNHQTPPKHTNIKYLVARIATSSEKRRRRNGQEKKHSGKTNAAIR